MRIKIIATCVVLAVTTVILYLPVSNHPFLNYDDPQNIYDNPRINHGFTLDNAAWAFKNWDESNWIPLTRLSWMIDWQLFHDWSAARDWPAPAPGQPAHHWAGGHHLVDVGLHTAGGILLLLVLVYMTGRLWPSAFVAALFLVHPLHVESVAWAVERKDTLSGLFWMLTLGAYAWYVRRPGAARYAVVAAMFALGLMAKPMLVTLPLVLLLLDWWPLGRIAGWPAGLISPAGGKRPAEAPSHKDKSARQRGRGSNRDRKAAGSPAPAAHLRPIGRLVLEKVPLLVLSIAASVVAFRAQEASGAVSRVADVTVPARLANALVAYVTYLGKAVVPIDMAIFYPYSPDVPVAWVAGAVICLAAVTFLVVVVRRERAYAAIGWLWFLGTLVPVLGLVQVGGQSMADRYTYLPLIGIFIAVAWGASDLAARWRLPPAVPAAAGAAVVAGCIAVTYFQLPYWAGNEQIYTHAIKVTSRNWASENNLGDDLSKQHRWDEAIEHLQNALKYHDNYAEAEYGLGNALAKRGRSGDAGESLKHLYKAIEIRPEYAEAHCNIGVALAAEGKTDDAIAQYEQAIHIKPRLAEAQLGLGIALATRARQQADAASRVRPDAPERAKLEAAAQENSAAAISRYNEAIALKPDFAEAHLGLGIILADKGQIDKAIPEFREAIRIDGDSASAHYFLGKALAAGGHAEEAVSELSTSLRLEPHNADTMLQLGVILASQGRMDEAITRLTEAVRIMPDLPEAHNYLARALESRGRIDEAIKEYGAVIQLRPTNPDAHYNLAMLLARGGRAADAISQYRDTLKFRTDWPPALMNLARIMAIAPETDPRNRAEAVTLAERACRLTERKGPAYLDTLAIAYAATGDFQQAIATAKEAIALADSLGLKQESADFKARLALYESGRAYHLEPAKP
jgi:protein O-mannosyl-transferase